MNIEIPRVLIGAIQGRSGKTTFTLGLLKALTDQGVSVQPFKKGPDYIDPSWMTFASGEQCRNLDLFMMGTEQVRNSFIRHSANHEISIVEGAMGLFDGLDVDGSNSSAELAYTIDAPIILVVNCTRLTRSVAALVNGVVGFDQRLHIGGIVLNHVARPRHQNILVQSIERYCDVPVLGILPKSKEIEIPDRHLGLIPAGEQELLHNRIELLGNLVRDNIDLDQLIQLAKNAKPVQVSEVTPMLGIKQNKVKIGVLRDKAFSFYYPENLEALEAAGAELIYIDSMQDHQLPDIDGMYIGGGFPEVMADEISANHNLLEQVKLQIEADLPVYAECGGLMFLVKHILVEGQSYPMVGIFDCDVEMKAKPQGIGYTVQKVLPNNPFFSEGMIVRGHEFHNSQIVNLRGNVCYGFHTERGRGIDSGFDGLVYKNTLAGYHHLHVGTAPLWANNMIAMAKKHQKNNDKNG